MSGWMWELFALVISLAVGLTALVAGSRGLRILEQRRAQSMRDRRAGIVRPVGAEPSRKRIEVLSRTTIDRGVRLCAVACADRVILLATHAPAQRGGPACTVVGRMRRDEWEGEDAAANTGPKLRLAGGDDEPAYSARP